MSGLTVAGLCKNYGEKIVLDRVDLAVPKGKIVALLGSSGAGKTTLGRIITGLEKADHGNVEKGGAAMLVAQDFVVFPRLTAYENVALGFRGAHAEKKERVYRALEEMSIAGLTGQKAGNLSYGQQQRVAVARAFCFAPDVLVLDEPFSHLDEPLRLDTVIEIREKCIKEGIATLWITHHAREALLVGDEVAILSSGRIEQKGLPEEIYWNSVSDEVGELCGPLNTFSPEIVKVLKSAGCGLRKDLKRARPEQFIIVESSGNNRFILDKIYFQGHGYLCFFKISGKWVKAFSKTKLNPGNSYGLNFTEMTNNAV